VYPYQISYSFVNISKSYGSVQHLTEGTKLLKIFGLLDFWTFGLFLDFWSFGLLDFWSFGLLDFWTFGLLDFWIIRGALKFTIRVLLENLIFTSFQFDWHNELFVGT
jgi:hypothetical protein